MDIFILIVYNENKKISTPFPEKSNGFSVIFHEKAAIFTANPSRRSQWADRVPRLITPGFSIIYFTDARQYIESKIIWLSHRK